MTKVLVLGSINMDCVATVATIPRPGETIMGDDLSYYPGGKGSNQAVASARLNANTTMIGCVGDDGFGKTLLDFLKEQKINTSHIQTRASTPTGTAFITVEASGENAITVIGGANAKVTADLLPDIQITDSTIAVTQNETPTAASIRFFKTVKDAGGTTLYNPAPALNVDSEIFDLSDIIIVNETELEHYAQSGASREEQLNSLRKFDEQIIIVTLGKDGALISTKDKNSKVDGHTVTAVDTTGAGDCFVGALASELAAGKSIDEAVEFANKAASIAVQNHGAGIGMPFRQDLT